MMMKNSFTGSNKVQPSPERLSIQLSYMERKYEEALTKVLEQNREILSSVALIKKELKSLRNKVDSLEVAAQDEPVNRVNGTNGVGSRTPDQRGSNASPAAGMMGVGHVQPPFTAPGFYNPYAAFSPYGVVPDATAYLMNPALMPYGFLGAFNPSAPPTVPTTAPFGFTGMGAVDPKVSTTTPVNLFANQIPADGSPQQQPQGGVNTLNGSSVSFGNVSGMMQTPEPVKLQESVKAAVVTPVPQSTPVASKPANPLSFSFASAASSKQVTSTSATAIFSTSASVPVTPPKAVTTTVASAPVKANVSAAPDPKTTSTAKPAFTFNFGGTSFATTSSITAPASLSKPLFTTTPTSATASKSSPVVSKPSEEKGTAPPKKEEPPKFGGFQNVDFSAKAADKPIFGASGSDRAPMFGTGKPFTFEGPKNIFGTVSAAPSDPASSSPSKGSNDDGEDDFVPTAEFAPVIPLPPLVEVKRGDENENVMFSHRAKLLRYVKSASGSGEWKERGLGDIKILQDKENLKKIRVVMWREKVHKIACNHWVTKDIKVTNYQGNPKNLMWTAFDFAEAEDGPKSEIFVCKFGQEDKAKEFKEQFEKAIALVDALPTTPSKTDAIKGQAKPNQTEELKPASSNVPLSQLFKKPEGTWSCKDCYSDNKKESLLCAACQAPNPNPSTCKPESQQSGPASAPKFIFGFGTTSSQAAGDATAKTTESKTELVKAPTFTFGASLLKPDTDSSQTVSSAPTTSTPTFSFGFAKTATTTAGSNVFSLKSSSVSSVEASTNGQAEKKNSTADTTTPFFDFSKKSSDMPSFASLATTNAPKPFSGGSNFGGTVQPVFGSTTAAPVFGAAAASSAVTNDDSKGNEDGEDDFVPTAEFAPVIPLPPLVEVKRGDENENVLFSQRAKLLRFVKNPNGSSEWKERGVGDIKILQNKSNESKIRVVMWREKVHKIACNHWVTKDIKVTNYQGSLKNLMWTALDFADSEEGAKSEIFVCRFGSEEKGQEFKAAFENAISLAAKGDGAGSSTSSNTAAPVATSSSLKEFCKKADGEWTCTACYISNKKESVTCAACSTPKSGAPSFGDLTKKAESLTLTDTHVNPHPNEGANCRGCDPEKFNFKALDERQVPVFEDIPKPTREAQSTPTSELKQLLQTKPTLVSPITPTSGSPSSSMSNFSFTLPGGASVSKVSNTSFGGDSKPPSSIFSPNFSSTASKYDANVPTTVASFSKHSINGSTAVEDQDDEDEDDDDEYEDDDDEEDTMYKGKAHAYFKLVGKDEFEDYGDGQVKILYDGDRFCARLMFLTPDGGEPLIDHDVEVETHVEGKGENTYEWDCTSYRDEETLRGRVRLVLPDQQSYDQFSTAMTDSVEIAHQITDVDPDND